MTLLAHGGGISHGGHGTTIKALAAGVPTLVMPLGRDQPDIGARLEHSGAGLAAEAERQAPRRDTANDMAVAELEAVAEQSTGARVAA